MQGKTILYLLKAIEIEWKKRNDYRERNGKSAQPNLLSSTLDQDM